MLTESASLTLAAPSVTVTPIYLPVPVRRLRPLTGKLLDEWVRPPAPKEEPLDRWELAGDEWEGGAE